MDRRKVLSSLAAGLSLPLAPIQLAEAAARTGRRLILVELSGANDGLNTVVPWANDRYRAIRPSVALDRSDLITLDDQLGLNNALSSLEPAWQAGEMAIIQGLGYPEQNRSHFKSIALWETGRRGCHRRRFPTARRAATPRGRSRSHRGASTARVATP